MEFYPDWKNIDEIIEIIHANSFKIIGIDGEDGNGKTTLGKELSNKTDYNHIDLDDYLSGKKESFYFKELNLEQLKQDIQKHDKLIISGILLLQTLKAISVKYDYLIFVDSASFASRWNDYKVSNTSFNDAVEKERENIEILLKRMGHYERPTRITPFRKELFRYTYDYTPFLKADCLYEYRDI